MQGDVVDMDENRKNIVAVSIIGFLILIMMTVFCKTSFDKLMNRAERTKINNPNSINIVAEDVNNVINWQLSNMLVHRLARPQDESVRDIIREGYKEYFNSNSELSEVEGKIIKMIPKGFGSSRPQALVSIPITVEHPASVEQICDIIKKRPSFTMNKTENTPAVEETIKYHQDFIVTNNEAGVYTVYMIFYDSGA